MIKTKWNTDDEIVLIAKNSLKNFKTNSINIENLKIYLAGENIIFEKN